MVEERKEIWESRPTPRMVIPGKIGEGHLDLFLLEAVRLAPVAPASLQVSKHPKAYSIISMRHPPTPHK